jgi:hypothetical protein
MSDTCTYPGCTDSIDTGAHCRKHGRSLSAAQGSLKLARHDRQPVTAWTCVFTVSSGLASRVVTSNDPIRRRDEMQSGSPYTLQIAGLVLANKHAARAISWMTEARLARLHHHLAEPCRNLRPHWFSVTQADAMMALPEAAAGVDGDLWDTPSNLADFTWDRSKPGDDRMAQLLEMIEQEGLT